MPAPISPQWVGMARAFPEGGAAVVVAGRGAPMLAEAFHRAGSGPPVFETNDLVVLSAALSEEDLKGIADVPDNSIDLVVLRRAWDSRADLDDVTREAYRIIKPGGRILAGDLDIDRLLSSSSIRYPSRIQYRAVPGAGDALRKASTRMLLPLEVMRAGFRAVATLEIDEVRGTYPDVEAYWDAVKGRGWPVFSSLDPAEAEVLLEESAGELRRIAPLGPVVDDEPWFVVTGVKA